jgi:hypothetical protein
MQTVDEPGVPSPATDRGAMIVCSTCRTAYPVGSTYCNFCRIDLDPKLKVSRFATLPAGRRLRRLAWLLRAIAATFLVYFLSVAPILKPWLEPPPFPDTYLLLAALAFPFFYTAARLTRRAKRLEQQSAVDSLGQDPRPAVVFLRPFGRDGSLARPASNFFKGWVTMGLSTGSQLLTFEELLVGELYVLGPVMAVNDPGERRNLPDIGALRVDLRGDAWLASVTELCDSAALIVAVLDETPGMKIELDLVTQPSLRDKTLLLLPVLASAAQQQSFYPTYLYLAQRYPFLPQFHPALVGIAFDPKSGEAEAVLAPKDLPDGKARSLVVANWLRRRSAHASFVDA